MSRPVALFDYDGTIHPGDSIVPFLWLAVRRGYAPRRQLLKAAAGFLRQACGRASVRQAKEDTLSFIAGKREAELDVLAREFLARQARGFRPDALREMRALRERGAAVVVVSASASVYMHLLGEYLPLDGVICTECEVRDGVYTGGIGPNCRGREKAERIRRAFPEDVRIAAAYGDSASDAPMLRLAERAVWVNPKKRIPELVPGAEIHRWAEAEKKI